MRKRVLTAAVMTATVLMLSASTRLPTVTSPPRSLSPETSVTVPTTRAVYRVVGVWQGRVAVFVPTATEPEQVFDTAVTSLPLVEQEKLKKGVEAIDASTLKRLLDDYLS